MKKRILVNFLYEEENKFIHFDYLILTLIILIVFLIGININLKFKISELEIYIEENNKYTTVSNLDHNIDKSLVHISNITEITKIIEDKNIEYININNNKLRLLGYSNHSSSIKIYIDRLNKSNEINNASIQSINREGDVYSFDIEAYVGYANEI